MNSKEKGDLVVAEAIAHYTRIGKQVLIPLGDRQKYDLVVDDGMQFLKVQCKYSSFKTKSGGFVAMACVKGGNKSCFTSTPYKKGDFDLLFAMTSDGDKYLIPSEEIEGLRSTITLGDKYVRFKILRVY